MHSLRSESPDIDTGDQGANKRIFDALLARRDAIEAAFEGPLTWERIDEKRASRIAVYYDNSVTIHSKPEELTALRIWGIDALARLYEALEQPVAEVMATPVFNGRHKPEGIAQ